MNIHKGDTVYIITGKDSGKTGKVIKIYSQERRVLIENLNLYKKHSRPKKQGEKGEIVTVPRPLDFSNVMLYCSSCKKPRKAGIRESGEKKVRYCKKCQASF